METSCGCRASGTKRSRDPSEQLTDSSDPEAKRARASPTSVDDTIPSSLSGVERADTLGGAGLCPRDNLPSDKPGSTTPASADLAAQRTGEDIQSNHIDKPGMVSVKEAIARVTRHLEGTKSAVKAAKAADIFVKLLADVEPDTALDFLIPLAEMAEDTDRLCSNDLKPLYDKIYAVAASKKAAFDTLPGNGPQLFTSVLLQTHYKNLLDTDESFQFERAIKEILRIIECMPAAEPGSDENPLLHGALLKTLSDLSAKYTVSWRKQATDRVFNSMAQKRMLLTARDRAQFDAWNTALAAKRSKSASVPSSAGRGFQQNSATSTSHPLLSIKQAVIKDDSVTDASNDAAMR